MKRNKKAQTSSLNEESFEDSPVSGSHVDEMEMKAIQAMRGRYSSDDFISAI